VLSEDERLQQQLRFVLEIDKLKSVQRRTWLTNCTRSENSAEHSWHLAVMVLLLHEHSAETRLDLFRAVQMALLHDLVEIDAGDTFVYDDSAAKDKASREQAAADRLFALLPDDRAVEFRQIWDEFEARESPEARFVAAVDRLQPLMHNYQTQGKAWREHGVTSDKVLSRNSHMEEGSPRLWEYARKLIADAVSRGFLAPPPS
jgi:putative hydrolase of HD superfamily